jgi:hypothetical protein
MQLDEAHVQQRARAWHRGSPICDCIYAEHAEHGPVVPITRARGCESAASDVSFCPSRLENHSSVLIPQTHDLKPQEMNVHACYSRSNVACTTPNFLSSCMQ